MDFPAARPDRPGFGGDRLVADAIRAVIILAYGILLVRLAGKRTFGKMSAFDIVLSIIIGSNLSRALTGNAPFWPTLAVTAVLAVLHWALGRLSIHSHWLGAAIKGSPRQIIRDGKLDESHAQGRTLRGDLEEALRLHGLEGTECVKSAYLERNGGISIIKTTDADGQPRLRHHVLNQRACGAFQSVKEADEGSSGWSRAFQRAIVLALALGLGLAGCGEEAERDEVEAEGGEVENDD
jgi:uncharacterized membrane protein YcaP (DUF421 family)